MPPSGIRFFTPPGGSGSSASRDSTNKVHTATGLVAGSAFIVYGNGSELGRANADGTGKAVVTLASAPAAGVVLSYTQTLPGGTIPSPVVGLGPTTATISSIVSAANRSRVSPNSGATNANLGAISRWRERTPVAGSGIQFWDWGGFVNAAITNGPQEVGLAGGTRTLGAAILTNLQGTGRDQTGATLTSASYQNAANNVAGYIWRYDHTTSPPTFRQPTSAEMAAEVSYNAATRRLTVPHTTALSYYVSTDPIPVTLAAREAFMPQRCESLSGAGARTLPIAARTDLGDVANQNISQAAAEAAVDAVNWNTGSATPVNQLAVTGNNIPSFQFITMTNTAGKRVVVTRGNSIQMGVGDYAVDAPNGFGSTAYGDADGTLGPINRMLHAAGYSFHRTAIAGTKASSEQTYGGGNIRMFPARWSTSAAKTLFVDEFGHNESSIAGGYSAFLSAHKASWASVRALGPVEVAATTLSPFAIDANYTASGITVSGGVATVAVADTSKITVGRKLYVFAGTAANALSGLQTVTGVVANTSFTYNTGASANGSGTMYWNDAYQSKSEQVMPTGAAAYPGGYIFAQYHPYLRGTLNPANGDPDRCFDFAYIVATALNTNDVEDGLWPANGTPYAETQEGTHLSTSGTVATTNRGLALGMPNLLGFAA